MTDSFDTSSGENTGNSLPQISGEVLVDLEFYFQQQELISRSKILELVENIIKLNQNEKLDENFYSLLLDFGKIIIDLGRKINICRFDSRVDVILGSNPHEEIINVLNDEKISEDIYPNLTERLGLEIAILDQKNGITFFILWQTIHTIKRDYNNMSGVDIEQLGNRIIETVNKIKEIEARLKEKNDELNLYIGK